MASQPWRYHQLDWYMVFLATVAGNVQKVFCPLRPVLKVEGAPFHVNNFMIRPRFRKFLNELTYTDNFPPLFVEKFWEARQMIRSRKEQTKESFIT